MEFHIIIPARFASTRLPGKMLLDIAGKPMLWHVYEKAKASGAETVTIATDHEDIQAAAKAFGADVIMTSVDHQSGTERISEAVEALGLDEEEVVIGLQGDEPMISPLVIRQLAESLQEHDNVKIASICQEIRDVESLYNPNIVKVVLNRRHFAMLFTRAPIPWQKAMEKEIAQINLEHHYHQHIGIYGYRVGFLKDFMNWPNCPFAELESLEQLRILWNGGRIFMNIAMEPVVAGIDTAEDLERVRSLFTDKNKGK